MSESTDSVGPVASEAMSDKFLLELIGGFYLRDPQGSSLDIPSKKGRGLLALLATAEHGERTRSWLQEHLWARGSSQDSLRKELSSLRALLSSSGLDPIPKSVPRDVIRLDLDCFDIDVRNPKEEAKGEFLEGLDIPHENNFEEWLREQRAYYDSLKATSIDRDPIENAVTSPQIITNVAPARFSIGLSSVVWDTANDKYVHARPRINDVLERIGRLLLCSGGIDLIDHRFDSPVPNPLGMSAARNPQAQLWMRATETSRSLVLSVQLMLSETHQVLCSRRSEFELDKLAELLEDSPAMGQFVAETVDEILFTLYRGRSPLSEDACGALRLVHEAIESMFELSYSGLDKARSSLSLATELIPESVIYAWRAFLSTQLVDDPRITDFDAIREEARVLSARAIELDRYNPLVRSLLTHVEAFTLRDFDRAREHMRQAKEWGSDHLMTYDADALLNLYLGNLKQSRESALHAVRLGRFLPYRYLFITSLCMIDGLAGNFESSILAGEKALQLQPVNADRPYPPTIRYLSESYARLGKEEKAHQLLNLLERTDKQSFTTIGDRAVPTLEIGDFLQMSHGILT